MQKPELEENFELVKKIAADIGLVASVGRNGYVIRREKNKEVRWTIDDLNFFSQAEALVGELNGLGIFSLELISPMDTTTRGNITWGRIFTENIYEPYRPW